ncbi:MAG TPA: histidine kinase dimerization/phospho-acceptor domain-containing protein [Usitatibacter sp.]|jgi:signal transduction histidine kinase|nr:histidine kinase dimerization/phospho-acceptor domain-containing protein [Usitatibacter sp.]
MTKTIWKVSSATPGVEAANQALRRAGLGLVEMDWDEARRALDSGEAAFVVADGEAISALIGARKASGGALPREVARALSHDLRTPLSAMAGWLHLMETGKLDEAGLKRAIEKLRGNIDDQVRTIERHLGATQEGSH